MLLPPGPMRVLGFVLGIVEDLLTFTLAGNNNNNVRKYTKALIHKYGTTAHIGTKKFWSFVFIYLFFAKPVCTSCMGYLQYEDCCDTHK